MSPVLQVQAGQLHISETLRSMRAGFKPGPRETLIACWRSGMTAAEHGAARKGERNNE